MFLGESELWFPGCTKDASTPLTEGSTFKDNGEIEGYKLTSSDRFGVKRQFADPTVGKRTMRSAYALVVGAWIFFNTLILRDLHKDRKEKDRKEKEMRL